MDTPLNRTKPTLSLILRIELSRDSLQQQWQALGWWTLYQRVSQRVYRNVRRGAHQISEICTRMDAWSRFQEIS